jgi:hypothetical protein
MPLYTREAELVEAEQVTRDNLTATLDFIASTRSELNVGVRATATEVRIDIPGPTPLRVITPDWLVLPLGGELTVVDNETFTADYAPTGS